MLPLQNSKNKIDLSNYPYQRDIKNRLILGTLTTFEKDVLEEIVNGSLKTSIEELADALDADLSLIPPVIEKLQPTELFILNSNKLLIDKEIRKYFECQLEKFSDDFEPDMEFVQGILKKVPIQYLPIWYSIPKTSDNIFESLLEKFFLSPRIYRRYLQETEFSHVIATGIVKDVFASPDLKVKAYTLREKYGLTREEFEEYMLHLEFNFLCFVGYTQIDGEWKEVVSPLKEWVEFLNFEKMCAPKPIASPEEIDRTRKVDFGFIMDMKEMIHLAKDHPIPVSQSEEIPYLLDRTSIEQLTKHCDSISSPNATNLVDYQEYFSHLVDKLCQTELAVIQNGALCVGPEASGWLSKSIEEQVVALHPQLLLTTIASSQYNDQDVRKIEKNLARIPKGTWVYMENFVTSMTSSIGNDPPVRLTKHGRNWRYTLPSQSEENHEFIRRVIQERLFELGIVALGKHNQKDCFRVTSFGTNLLGLDDLVEQFSF